MGTLRCDVCLDEKKRAIPASFLPPLLHKHLGILICGELLCCEDCSQKVQDWDIFASQTIQNLAISHPTVKASLQERIEKMTLLTAKIQQDTWGLTSTAMGLHHDTFFQKKSEGEVAGPVTTSKLLVDNQEVFGCMDAQAVEDEEEDMDLSDEFAESSHSPDRRQHFVVSPSQETVQDTFEDMKPSFSDSLSQYPCSQCHRKFLHEDVLNLHMKIRHNIENNIKTQTATTTTKVKHHIPLCPKCNIKFSCNQYLLNHVMEYHAKEINGYFCCIFCSQLLKSPGSLKYHTKKHFNSTNFIKCSYCPKHLSTTDNLDQHIQLEHHQLLIDKKASFSYDKQQCVYICPLCFKGISSKHNLEGHVRSCKDNIKCSIDINNLSADSEISSVLKFTCEFCFRVLTSEKKLDHHFYRCHHEDNQRETSYIIATEHLFSCEFCDAKLISKLFLQYHVQRRHLDAKPQERDVSNQCNFCGIVYSSVQMLRYHIARKHQEAAVIDDSPFKRIKPPTSYMCNFCQTPMCSKQGLQKHILTYHTASNKNSKFPCTICDNGFDSKAGLFHHMRHHPPVVNINLNSPAKKVKNKKKSKSSHKLNYKCATPEETSFKIKIPLKQSTTESKEIKHKTDSTKGKKHLRVTRSAVRNFFAASTFNAIKNEEQDSSNYHLEVDDAFGNSQNSSCSISIADVYSCNASDFFNESNTTPSENFANQEAGVNGGETSNNVLPYQDSNSQESDHQKTRDDKYGADSLLNNLNQGDIKPFVCQVCFTILHSEIARMKHAKKCQGVKLNTK